MPTIRQLQYLAAIEDHGHFGKAAETLAVTQPTLSQQIRELELRLGARLVERGRPVRLTPIGREISGRARRVLREISDIRLLAERGADGMAGTIRLGVSPTIGPYLMPLVVVRLHRDFPHLKLYIREGIPADQLIELRNGGLDMLLSPRPIASGDLHCAPLFDEPLQLVGAPDHRLFAKTSLRRRDLAGEPILSLDRRHPTHRLAEEFCEETGAELLRDYEGTSLDSLRQMAGSGLGLSLLPELYLRSETGGEDMVRRFDIKDWSKSRSIGAIWRKDSAFAESYAAISEVVSAEARERLA